MSAYVPPSSFADRQRARDGRLAAAAVVLVIAATLSTVRHILNLAIAVHDDLPTGIVFGRYVEIAASLLAIAGFALFVAAFRSASAEREGRLRLGFLLTAVASAGFAVAPFLYLVASFPHSYPGGYRVALSLDGLGCLVLAVGAYVGARGFPPNGGGFAERGRAAGRAAAWFAVGFALAAGSSLYYEGAYSRYFLSGDYGAGLIVEAVGGAILAAASATAAVAFLRSTHRRAGDSAGFAASREQMLSGAAGVFAIGSVLTAVGAALVAVAYADSRAAEAVAAWLAVGTEVGYVLAAVLALSGFMFEARPAPHPLAVPG